MKISPTQTHLQVWHQTMNAIPYTHVCDILCVQYYVDPKFTTIFLLISTVYLRPRLSTPIRASVAAQVDPPPSDDKVTAVAAAAAAAVVVAAANAAAAAAAAAANAAAANAAAVAASDTVTAPTSATDPAPAAAATAQPQLPPPKVDPPVYIQIINDFSKDYGRTYSTL